MSRVVTATGFDSLGRTAWTSAPFNDSEPAQVGSGLVNPDPESLASWTENTFDSRGRVVAQSLMHLDSVVSTSSTQYEGLTTWAQDALGSGATSTVDVLGRLVEQSQCATVTLGATPACTDPITTEYTYETLTTATGPYEGVGFQKVTVADPEDNETVFVSNLAGQRTFMSDPNSGESTYTYDLNGQSTKVSSAAGDVFMGYDPLRRMTLRRAFEDGVADGYTGDQWKTSTAWESETTWAYGTGAAESPLGALVETVNRVNIVKPGDTGATLFQTTSTVTDYDSLNRPVISEVTLPEDDSLGDLSGYTYSTTVTYDSETGVAVGASYPAVGGLPAETVTTGYRLNGMAETLTLSGTGFTTEVVTGTTVDATGLLLSREYGNGVTRAIAWDQTLRIPAQISASFEYLDGGNPTTAFLQLDTLTRDIAGRVTSIDDQVIASTQCYDYDEFNRLEAAWTADGTCGTAPTSVKRLRFDAASL